MCKNLTCDTGNLEYKSFIFIRVYFVRTNVQEYAWAELVTEHWTLFDIVTKREKKTRHKEFLKKNIWFWKRGFSIIAEIRIGQIVKQKKICPQNAPNIFLLEMFLFQQISRIVVHMNVTVLYMLVLTSCICIYININISFCNTYITYNILIYHMVD
jgi:hypothetical protein